MDGLNDQKLPETEGVIDGGNLQIKDDSKFDMNETNSRFNPNKLIFTVSEIIIIILFLNLLLCSFIKWKLKRGKRRGYHNVKIVDSSSEFGTETEMEEIDIGIQDDDISIIQD